jgi:outer membrane lipoprotein-sorting protein
VSQGDTSSAWALLLAAGGIALAGALPGLAAVAEPELTGREIAERNNARDDGAQVSRTFVMELISKRGKVRRRVTRIFRRDFGDERRSILFFEDPPSLEGTALLTYDYPEVGRNDDQWIYLPALRKSRRIAAADRGRSFLGTDLSFEDIKKETRVGLGDYRWNNLGPGEAGGAECWLLEGIPVDDETARALGYSRVLLYVDAEIWIPRRVDYWNVPGEALKTVALLEIRKVDGIWTAHRIEAHNLRNGHRTHLRFEDVDYGAELSSDLFTERALSRGAP